ncbi:MAG: hypothetical protein JNK53_02610 [Phycisphaerae bacterium]|nr:hypothetical protein [Phycisphaerae bacterium]
MSFVIATVALLATTIYFYVENQRAEEVAKNARDGEKLAKDKERKTEDAYGQLVGFVTGDPSARPEGGLDVIKKSLSADNVSNLKIELDTLRSNTEQAQTANASMKKQLEAAKADAASARKEAEAAKASAQAAAKGVDDTLGTYRTSTEKYGTEVKDAVTTITRIQDEIDERRRNEVAGLQGQIDNLSSSRAELSTRLAEMQGVVDQVRAKPENAAKLVDGRVIEVGGPDGELYISLGSKNRLQPGMIFDVYDDAASIQYDPGTNNLVPGKARIQVLKVTDTTSTARVIPEASGARASGRRPVVKDDVLANPIYSPDYRYKFLVHGKFDIDNDGRATAAEADYVRGRVAAWGGEVVTGETLRGDLDFVVLGVQPIQPPALAADANEAAYTQYYEAKQAHEAYRRLYDEAQAARVPVLNWNRLQVLTNEGR